MMADKVKDDFNKAIQKAADEKAAAFHQADMVKIAAIKFDKSKEALVKAEQAKAAIMKKAEEEEAKAIKKAKEDLEKATCSPDEVKKTDADLHKAKVEAKKTDAEVKKTDVDSHKAKVEVKKTDAEILAADIKKATEEAIVATKKAALEKIVDVKKATEEAIVATKKAKLEKIAEQAAERKTQTIKAAVVSKAHEDFKKTTAYAADAKVAAYRKADEEFDKIVKEATDLRDGIISFVDPVIVPVSHPRNLDAASPSNYQFVVPPAPVPVLVK